MRIIPATNADTIEKFRTQLHRFSSFLPHDATIHIDLCDGKFTSHKTLLDLSLIAPEIKKTPFRFEGHFMVNNPELLIPNFLSQAISRALIPVEVFHHYEKIFEWEEKYAASLAFSARALKSDELLLYALKKSHLRDCLILAVPPGPAGQTFDPHALQSVTKIKNHFPDCRITVDGGVTPILIPLLKDLGVDAVVLHSTFITSGDPSALFFNLSNI
ncbi:MAG: hypothetical protein FJY91_00785 [Candidatus Harrisonbacteria bacterium]|nr:hypothetical protein [Candidatus Harrisonbacteria bacterium]